MPGMERRGTPGADGCGHGEALSGRRFAGGGAGRSDQSPKESSKSQAVHSAIARQTITQVSAIQRKLKKKLGTPFVFLGDEIYIMATEPLPPMSHYRDFPQIENGVGMVRTFLKQFDAAIKEEGRSPDGSGGPCARGRSSILILRRAFSGSGWI